MAGETHMTYAVQYAQLSGRIHAGRLDKTETRFTSKDDVTDAALLAVAQYVRQEGGVVVIGSLVLSVKEESSDG